jgi:hypothetical protein
MRLPKLSRYSSPNPGGGRTVNASVNISVVTPDAESFLESQNQIANRTVGAFSRAARTQ